MLLKGKAVDYNLDLTILRPLPTLQSQSVTGTTDHDSHKKC